MMYRTVTVTPTISNNLIEVNPAISNNLIEVTAEIYNPFYSQDIEYYTGPYEFTPTDQTQTISIDNKMATQNITINPVPSNYGLITWDGSTLTVS